MAKILCLSNSIVEFDPRVLRQCEALVKAGHHVEVVGLHCDDPSNNSLKIHHLPELKPRTGFPYKLERIKYYLYLIFLKFTFFALWKSFYWREATHQYFFKVSEKNIDGVDLIIANDWDTLPVARKLFQKFDVKFGYDSHEHALTQFNISSKFRLLISPYINRVEKNCIQDCSFLTSVSDGLVDKIKEQYNLKIVSETIRSTPHFVKVDYRETNEDHIKLYYHGYLKHDRNLESIIESLKFLPENYSLIFRGAHPSSRTYEQELIQYAKIIGVDRRFKILPMADYKELINLASEGDIGIINLKNISAHFDLALPNKFFEYIMAGLMVLTTPMGEMKKIINQNKIGEADLGYSAQEISDKILAIKPDTINECRKNSLNLAQNLNWEKESLKLNDLIDKVMNA
jgi:glycogen(starch) synthase